MWKWIEDHANDVLALLMCVLIVAVILIILGGQLAYSMTGEQNFICRFFNSCSGMVRRG